MVRVPFEMLPDHSDPDSLMDSTSYNNISGSDGVKSCQGPKFIFCQGWHVKPQILLYAILLFLLLILLLLTGVKFSQLNQEVLAVKLFLISINSTVLHIGAMEPKSEHLTGGPAPCKEDWLAFRRSCYQFPVMRLNWEGAKKKCIEMGAHLIVINDEEEQEFITGTDLYENRWIGLVEREENKWTWVDGTDFATTEAFWDEDQPDNWSERENGEDCGQFHGTGLWNDADCNRRYKFICEKAMQ